MFFSHMSDMWEKIRAVEGLGHRFFSACPKCDALAGGLKKPATSPRAVALRLSSPLLKKEVITSLLFCTRLCLVPRRGLEPPRIAPLVPKTSAYTNSATWAYYNIQFWRPRAESNRRIRVLQTLALPLGD